MRTDIHSPVNMDPEAYEYVYAYDLQQPGCLIGVDMEWWGNIQRKMARIHEGGQCDHCGARLRYVAIMRHIERDEYIEVGETCLDNRFSLESKADFDRLRRAAQLDRAVMRTREEAERFLDSRFGQYDASVIAFLGDRLGETEPRYHDIAADIREKLWRYGGISERQLALVQKLIRETLAPPAPEVPKVDAPEGRLQVEGRVVSTKWQMGDFGSQLKMLVLVTTDSGEYKIWSTVPHSLTSVERGHKVRFTATLTRSRDDASFAIAKRPSKGEIC